MKRVLFCILSIIILLSACGKHANLQSEPSAPTWQEQYDLGVHYLSEGNYEEAIIAFTAAIEIDPKQALAYVGRGDAYMQFGETEENLTAAKADYEKAIELDESSADAYLGLADVYIQQGKNEKAIELLHNSLEIIGENHAIQNKLSKLEELHKYDKIDIFDNLIEYFSANNLDQVKNTIRSDLFWTTCQEKGTPINSKLSIYYVDISNDIGIYLLADLNGYNGSHEAECYFGTWVENKLEGEGIVCIYNGPEKKVNNSYPWMNYEDWTFTYATFKSGLSSGYCERVREGCAGVNELVVPYTEVVSGNTNNGLWNGAISDITTYEDGSVTTRIGYIENGLCDEEDTFNQPDNSYRIDTDVYSMVDPIRGTIFNGFINTETNYSDQLMVKALSE